MSCINLNFFFLSIILTHILKENECGGALDETAYYEDRYNQQRAKLLQHVNLLANSQWRLEGIEASAMITKMLADAIIKSGSVPKEKRGECLSAASKILAVSKDKSIALLSADKIARRRAFLYLAEEVKDRVMV